jgi:hypothetical protein
MKDILENRSITRRRFLQVSGAFGFTIATTAAGGRIVAQTPAVPAELSQSPFFEGQDLPPVAERIGDMPLVLEPIEAVGTYGGTWRTARSAARTPRGWSEPSTTTISLPGRWTGRSRCQISPMPTRSLRTVRPTRSICGPGRNGRTENHSRQPTSSSMSTVSATTPN